MKSISFLILMFFGAVISFGQTISLFQVTDGAMTDSVRAEIVRLKNEKTTFFEDDSYIVSRTCSGEWGGTVKFKNKLTGIEYARSATCPVSVNKLDGRYFVTCSLAHLLGSTEIFEIQDPESMEVYKRPPPKWKGRKVVKYVGDDESRSHQGAKVLLDSVGVLTLGSFLFDGELFHIVTDHKRTYVAKVDNKKFVVIEPIANERLWSYDTDVVRISTNRWLIPISGGYLDIFDNQIRILR